MLMRKNGVDELLHPIVLHGCNYLSLSICRFINWLLGWQQSVDGEVHAQIASDIELNLFEIDQGPFY